MKERVLNTVVIGGGPAGIGPFVAADRRGGSFRQFMENVALIDKGNKNTLGQGGLQSVHTSSNSGADDFLLPVSENGMFRNVMQGPSATVLREAGNDYVTLSTQAAPFLGDLGQMVGEELGDNLHVATTVKGIQLSGSDQNPYYIIRGENGLAVAARDVVLALGSTEYPMTELDQYNDKLVLSGQILTGEKLDEVGKRFANGEHVVFVGASHSTFSAAREILEGYEESSLGSISVVTRKKPKLYYDSPKSAYAAGYSFEPGDICTMSDKVNRFGGTRGPAGKVAERFIGDNESRLTIQQVGSLSEASGLLDRADVVVQATGYRAITVPVYDRSGNLIGPHVDLRGHVGVDSIRMNVLGHDGAALPNIYGIGHGYGISASPDIGGEANFGGRVDAVVLFHGRVGERVVEQVLSK